MIIRTDEPIALTNISHVTGNVNLMADKLI